MYLTAQIDVAIHKIWGGLRRLKRGRRGVLQIMVGPLPRLRVSRVCLVLITVGVIIMLPWFPCTAGRRLLGGFVANKDPVCLCVLEQSIGCWVLHRKQEQYTQNSYTLLFPKQTGAWMHHEEMCMICLSRRAGFLKLLLPS